ncbi:3,4-dihydroxy-2-butanone-4-phosphate synthase [Nitrosopumilus sp. K4]|uniref:3,4-dihydroxy-2-butanone-4-phosphate synthase n=1 Tax=Nitrosopumilus sp. K4 TaxID=2795383 RepID=UPI001BA9858F|nr:3,4-dihydroxy-2-butanone-4-phosphate synthase [Nitrosopumilus sp. K4]QUC64749.1 3,4-dihydroxy-2-butanone-4-phosphate synthase [Nitrosopumilus sp. K4]
MTLESALQSLKRGEFVLLFDSAGRENEIDMVVAAEFVTPEHVARMRQHAGGLLCIAIDNAFANSLGLRYMHEILDESNISNKEMIMGLAPYGDHPTFSIYVNHYQTYTGITDKDRSLTITEMANLYNVENKKKKFVSSFKTPGHIPLLIASKGLIKSRQGHTEMSVYLAQIAGLTPVTAICEMMDAETYTALSVDKAEKYAKQNGIPLIDGKELLEYAKVH